MTYTIHQGVYTKQPTWVYSNLSTNQTPDDGPEVSTASRAFLALNPKFEDVLAYYDGNF